MVEPEDLINKADALMARHRPPRTSAEPYAAIPVLDEVVELPPESDDLPVLTEIALPAPPDAQQIEALAPGIRTALLEGLQPEIDALLEDRLKQTLSPLFERMFHDLHGELRLIARDVLGDAIQSAVERELDRRKQAG